MEGANDITHHQELCEVLPRFSEVCERVTTSSVLPMRKEV